METSNVHLFLPEQAARLSRTICLREVCVDISDLEQQLACCVSWQTCSPVMLNKETVCLGVGSAIGEKCLVYLQCLADDDELLADVQYAVTLEYNKLDNWWVLVLCTADSLSMRLDRLRASFEQEQAQLALLLGSMVQLSVD